MKKENKLFIFYIKCLLLCLPFLLLVAIYIYEDPFLVLRQYDNYDHCHTELSEGDIGWKKLNMYRNTRHYDSFIMGSSCTKAFQTADWNQYIHGRPFRFFGNSEGLGDLCLKLQALDRLPNQPVKNLLIVTELSFYEKPHPQPGIMHLMPSEVTGKTMASYQATYLQGFLFPKFLLPYLKYKVTGRYDDASRDGRDGNEAVLRWFTRGATLQQEREINEMGEGYWQQKHWTKALKQTRKVHLNPPVIGADQINKLIQIRDFCRRHQTRLKVIIGPSFDLKQFNAHDLHTMKAILGDSAVYDFSTYEPLRDYHQYYDPGHYRRCAGQEILRKVY